MNDNRRSLVGDKMDDLNFRTKDIRSLDDLEHLLGCIRLPRAFISLLFRGPERLISIDEANGSNNHDCPLRHERIRQILIDFGPSVHLPKDRITCTSRFSICRAVERFEAAGAAM